MTKQMTRSAEEKLQIVVVVLKTWANIAEIYRAMRSAVPPIACGRSAPSGD